MLNNNNNINYEFSNHSNELTKEFIKGCTLDVLLALACLGGLYLSHKSSQHATNIKDRFVGNLAKFGFLFFPIVDLFRRY